MFKWIFIITNLAYIFFFIHNSLQLPTEKNRGCCSTLSTPCSRAPVGNFVWVWKILHCVKWVMQNHFDQMLAAWCDVYVSCVSYIATLLTIINWPFRRQNAEVTFKPSSFALVNSANPRNQIEPVAKSLWRELSFSHKIQHHLDSYWNNWI